MITPPRALGAYEHASHRFYSRTAVVQGQEDKQLVQNMFSNSSKMIPGVHSVHKAQGTSHPQQGNTHATIYLSLNALTLNSGE
jgi:hypothetical protein